MATLQQEQAPVDLRIAQAVVDGIPDTWESALLEVIRSRAEDGGEILQSSIQSPEGHQEVVTPSEKLLTSVRELSQIFVRHRHPWRQVQYHFTRTDSRGWDFRHATNTSKSAVSRMASLAWQDFHSPAFTLGFLC